MTWPLDARGPWRLACPKDLDVDILRGRKRHYSGWVKVQLSASPRHKHHVTKPPLCGDGPLSAAQRPPTELRVLFSVSGTCVGCGSQGNSRLIATGLEAEFQF